MLGAVTTTGRDEVEWITETVGRIFPEAWESFERASHRRPGERVVEAYARVLATGTPAERVAAADAWDAWEATHVSLDPNHVPGPLHDDPVQRQVFATLVTHYWANEGFLPGDRAILNRVDELAHIPAVLIHGRHDVSGPVITPVAAAPRVAGQPTDRGGGRGTRRPGVVGADGRGDQRLRARGRGWNA